MKHEFAKDSQCYSQLFDQIVTWLLALGHVLRNKVKIKEEERQSMKCMEGTQIEEGSKWLKKHKKRNEVKESNPLKEKIKEDKATMKIDRGQVSKQKMTPMGALDHFVEKKEEQVIEVLKMRVMWTLGFGTWDSVHGFLRVMECINRDVEEFIWEAIVMLRCKSVMF
jgi:hypothetical protein